MFLRDGNFYLARVCELKDDLLAQVRAHKSEPYTLLTKPVPIFIIHEARLMIHYLRK